MSALKVANPGLNGQDWVRIMERASKGKGGRGPVSALLFVKHVPLREPVEDTIAIELEGIPRT